MNATRTGWPFSMRKDSLSSRASDIYGGLVAQARAEAFYAVHGVPDTPEGRLELIMLHVALATRRLSREGEAGGAAAQAVAEAFITDIDDCMREMGVGDLMVAKKVKKAAGALLDRVRDYGSALAGRDRSILAELIRLHVLMAADGHAAGDNAGRIADYTLQAEAQLAMVDAAALWGSPSPFPNVPGLKDGSTA